MTRVVLDEGVPKVLARKLGEFGIDATAFPNDWKQLSNGALLAEIERRGFDILITNDKRMQFQQSLEGRKVAVLVLPTNLRPELMTRIPDIVQILPTMSAGTFHRL